MSVKDTLNKISGITALAMFGVIILGYFSGNDSLLGFPNAMLLYALMPSVLIWFGTRKNGCGSCNQSCETLESKQERNNKNDI
ncbi:MAG: hypothetical protein ACE5DU_03715 [Nitrosopumilus sp.]